MAISLTKPPILRSDSHLWEVQQFFFITGWINCWSETEGEFTQPLRFATEAIAEQELTSYFEELDLAIAQGEMTPYDKSVFRVERVKDRSVLSYALQHG